MGTALNPIKITRDADLICGDTRAMVNLGDEVQAAAWS
jgi:hypothetical protein